MSAHQLLKQLPLFSNLDEPMVEALASLARVKRYGAREVIFNEGDICDGFYILAEGSVKLYKLSGDGREHVLHLIGPGETFAEAALFLGDAYPAYAETMRASRMYLMPKQPFLELIEANPKIAIKMLGSMAAWLRRLVGQVEFLALRDASARLAEFLLEEAKGDTAALKAPKATVASHLGMTPETLSRLFFKLESAKILKVDGRTITILDPERLREIGDMNRI